MPYTTKNESFDELINQMLATYIFETSQFDEDSEDTKNEEDAENDVTDREVSQQINVIKQKKQKEIASTNPVEVKKVLQGAKKIGLDINSNKM